MAVFSRVNPTFPIPGIDQSSKGFRDNFQIIKTEIENLQSKTIQLTGDVRSTPYLLDSGVSPVIVHTTGLVFRKSFAYGDTVANSLSVVHNLNQQYVLVQVSNNLKQIVQPTSITLQDSNTVILDLTNFGSFAGTWHVIVRG